LDDKVDSRSVECLNQSTDFPVKNILSGADPEALLASDDDDPQLLIKVSFLEKVRVAGIHIIPSDKEGDEETFPATVKIFSNNMSLGFSEAESEPALETWELSVDAGAVHALQHGGAKFKNVDILQIFVESNAGADITKVKSLHFYGQPVDTGEKHWSVTNPSAAYK